MRHNGLYYSPQLQIDIDQRKAQALGVDIDDIKRHTANRLGSSYVNDFMDRGSREESLCAGSCAVSHAAR
ncbi:efflux RND transporter permease subunit [Escherichia coli]